MTRLSRLLLALVVFAASLAAARAEIVEVGAVGLTVSNLDAEIRFFTEVLPFERVCQTQLNGRSYEQLTGVSGARARQATLRLGDEQIHLREFVTPRGRPMPPDSRSFDHWFQHIAIVVSDMEAAYAHLQRNRVRHVSTAPQTLPAWNTNAGGIKAFYFRDPEDHVLEVIWFPPGKGDQKWQGRKDKLFLGIDHTAIVVSDTEASLRFYRDALGLRVAGTSENYGPEQERLNQVFGARLRITALRAERGIGIEFLEYIAPPGGRPLVADARANDAVFWLTELLSRDPEKERQRLKALNAIFVSRPAASPIEPFIVRDPDGHALHVAPAGSH